jgi:hypothetical protein
VRRLAEVRVIIVAAKRVMTVERRMTGKKIISAKDKVKTHHRKSRQRVSKMKKPCGSATRPNAASGARRCS